MKPWEYCRQKDAKGGTGMDNRPPKKKAGHRSWAARNAPVPGKHNGDIMSREKRSKVMSRIRGKNTTPERMITKELRRRKLRYQKHRNDLPGRPDIVFPGLKVAVFIDGDFWHGWRFPLWQHKLSENWKLKISENRKRDQRNFRKLRKADWKVLRIWEHQVERDADACARKIVSCLLQSDRSGHGASVH